MLLVGYIFWFYCRWFLQWFGYRDFLSNHCTVRGSSLLLILAVVDTQLTFHLHYCCGNSSAWATLGQDYSDKNNLQLLLQYYKLHSDLFPLQWHIGCDFQLSESDQDGPSFIFVANIFLSFQVSHSLSYWWNVTSLLLLLTELYLLRNSSVRSQSQCRLLLEEHKYFSLLQIMD